MGHPMWLVAAGTAIDATTGWAVYHFLGPRHPRLVRIAFYSAAAYRTYLAIHNVRMMQQAQRLGSVSSLDDSITAEPVRPSRRGYVAT